jgi:phosphoribosylamine--glycine ligase/phosphoribosylformylglycinamidine cyclo-ligase
MLSKGLNWLISSADLPRSLNFFYIGTRLIENGSLVTSKGCVIAVSTTADSLEKAVKLAYTSVFIVNFKGMFYRRDITYKLVLQKFI